MVGVFENLRDCLRAGEPVTLATIIEFSPPEPGSVLVPDPTSTSTPMPSPALGAKILVRINGESWGSFGESILDHDVVLDALDALEVGQNTIRTYRGSNDAQQSSVTVFFQVFAPPRQMLIFGAVDFTAALVRVAKTLDYRVTVCDARPVFATAARFPEADEVVADWPQRYLAKVGERLGPHDAICVLSHDHKFDVPTIVAALGTRVGYIGAMGSRRTHAERIELLKAEGIEGERLARIMAPIGMNIGARTPEETAIAIVAEIIALQAAVPVASLRDQSGPIHPARP